LEGIVFLGLAAAVIFQWLKYRHQAKMKTLELDRGSGGDPQTLQQLQHAQQQVHHLAAAKSEMDERVRNLETIVCSVDFELNAKLNRLASRQLAASQSRRHTGEYAETEAVGMAAIAPGDRVAGRFVVQEPLGAGGMGAVYRARDEQLGEVVALKVIAGAGLLDPAAADRFRREASAARRISHPNVVRIHDIGQEQGVLFLSMEYISGISLAALLERQGTIALAQLRDIVVQICKGLDAAHEAGVVHRDLKPANVLIDERQQVKIIDFGLARLPHLEGMTATGLILGTPDYMAPEQVRGRPVDPRTDVYALGTVLYHALVGCPPFRGDTPIAVGFAHCNERLQSPSSANGAVPTAWSDLTVKAMAKDPTQRFDSAAQLAASLPPA